MTTTRLFFILTSVLVGGTIVAALLPFVSANAAVGLGGMAIMSGCATLLLEWFND